MTVLRAIRVINWMLVIILSIQSQQEAFAIPLLHRKNQDCDPSGSGWTAYSGIRISHEILLRIDHQISSSQLYQLHEEYFSNTETLAKIAFSNSTNVFVNVDHNMILTKCDYGDIVSQIFVPLGPIVSLPWNQTICTSGKNCYRLARRKRFLNRGTILHFPGTIVGGVFEQNQNETSWKPVLPLFAELPFHSWTQLKFGTAFNRWHVSNISEVAFSHRIPLLYTPDILDRHYPRSLHWTKYIDPFEKYRSFPDPRKLRNMASDWLSKVTSKDIEDKLSDYIAKPKDK